MKLVRSATPIAVSGIVKSELTLVLATDKTLDPNAAIDITASGIIKMSFATHYISSISRSGEKITIKAQDRMKKLDNAFDYSAYNKDKEPFITSLVLDNLAQQCGFDNSVGIFEGVPTLYYDEIKDKTCKEILDIVSQNECLVWYCTNDNILTPHYLGEYKTAIYTNSSESSAVYMHSTKGPIRCISATNTQSGDVVNVGLTGDYHKVLKLKGSRMNKERASAILSNISGYIYHAFYCDYVKLNGSVDGLTAFSFDGGDLMISHKTTIHFNGYNIYVSAQSVDVCEDESDYSDYEYDLRQKIEEGRFYGSAVMSTGGLSFISKDEYSESEEPCTAKRYSFTTQKGGITSYDSVIMGATPSSIEKVSDNEVMFSYDDYKIKVTANGSGDTRTNLAYTIIYNDEEG